MASVPFGDDRAEIAQIRFDLACARRKKTGKSPFSPHSEIGCRGSTNRERRVAKGQRPSFRNEASYVS